MYKLLILSFSIGNSKIPPPAPIFQKLSTRKDGEEGRCQSLFSKFWNLTLCVFNVVRNCVCYSNSTQSGRWHLRGFDLNAKVSSANRDKLGKFAFQRRINWVRKLGREENKKLHSNKFTAVAHLLPGAALIEKTHFFLEFLPKIPAIYSYEFSA